MLNLHIDLYKGQTELSIWQIFQQSHLRQKCPNKSAMGSALQMPAFFDHKDLGIVFFGTISPQTKLHYL